MKKILFVIIALLICVESTYAKVEKNSFQQPEEYQAITNQANVFYAENDIKKAFELFLSIPEDKRSPQNWLLLGNILQDQGKLDEAIFMYKQAIQVDEKYYKAYYNLGNIYLQQDKPNMAVTEYKKVTKLNPDYAYGHYNLACAYIKLGKYSSAKYELYNAIDLKNTVADFYYNLAYVFKKLNNEKKAKETLEHYNKLMENQYVQGDNF